MRYSYISFYNIDEIQRYKVKLSVIGKNLNIENYGCW